MNNPTSFRLSSEGSVLLNRLARYLAIGRRDVIEVALRVLAEQQWPMQGVVQSAKKERPEAADEPTSGRGRGKE